ncbi:hypothetical protein CEXT_754911 [Caerostris extrusa]|uniref:Uncharacterized protein n=1 Tax=Caerostris extrusa TaxID=172846 RepID=A0AAV4YB93_CAEEX|nr:hypothetical protein CEXT_754911 [Caerostris extrusa]
MISGGRREAGGYSEYTDSRSKLVFECHIKEHQENSYQAAKYRSDPIIQRFPSFQKAVDATFGVRGLEYEFSGTTVDHIDFRII